MLRQLFSRPLPLRLQTLTLLSSSSSSSPLPPPPRPNPRLPFSGRDPTRSFLLRSLRFYSASRGDGGDDDDGTWKLSPEFDEVDSVFGDITEGGEEAFVSEAVEDAVKGFTGGSGDPWAEGAASDSKGDVFEDIDREVASKEGGRGVGEEEWGTIEGYKPWTLGEDEETGDVFGAEEIEEAEKDVADEKQKLEEREKELLETLKDLHHELELLQEIGIFGDFALNRLLRAISHLDLHAIPRSGEPDVMYTPMSLTMTCSISVLRYNILSGLESLQDSRKILTDRILEIDQTLGNPKDEDIERQRCCPNCYDGNGSLCIQCELDILFQVYEAKLFLIKKSHDVDVIASVEEAIDLQRRKYEFNLFFRNRMTLVESDSHDEKGTSYTQQSYKVSESFPYKWINKKWKEGFHVTSMTTAGNRWGVVMSRNSGYSDQVVELDFLYPSEGIHRRWESGYRITSTAATPDQAAFILSIPKRKLMDGTQETLRTSAFPSNHVKAMRKEYSQARFLSIAQAQFLRAPDEIKMSTSRLRLKETEDEPSAINVLTREDLIPTSMQLSSDKFSSSSSMACIKGQLRYLKGLVLSNQKTQNQCINSFSKAQDNANFQTSSVSVEETANKIDDEPCPICQERYYEQKMMFQCGHSLCCNWNDVLGLLEHALVANGVMFVRMKGGRKSQVALAQFKGDISVVDSGKTKRMPSSEKSIQSPLDANPAWSEWSQSFGSTALEPLLNLAAEAQAINRIHRVGQGKKTFIHRFIVKDSIEERVSRS
ncbi:E3 ubiquitin-protein ligase SHPRH [Ananas comosus]|uniref:E3 ubiquitin-protein ligase SHPRH n=1 Tax=Ananas comosus TaxID=4615 RepID=A0A199VQJ8_ANACO|nr:E3 ubiquitin-protein ligase SHPRH [Ananas comosus]